MAVKRLRVPIVGQHSEHRSINVNSQETTNLMVQIEADGAKNAASLMRTPGLKLTGNVASGSCRTPNPIFWDGAAYMVIGSQLVKVDSGGTATALGAIGTSSGNVSLSSNPVHIVICDGTSIWTSTGGAPTVVSSGEPTNPTMVTFLDGYTIANEQGTGTFQISSLNDATTWDSLDVATAESNPDDVTAVFATHKELWLFGPQTSEIWYNSGNADFPFEPYRNGTVEWGILAPFSIAKADESLFWLSQNREGGGMVLSARGFSPSVISTRDIDQEIAALSVKSDAIGWTYQQNGHTFYVLSFPTGDLTLVYDVASNMWHKRKSSDIGRWRAFGTVFNGTKHYCGDYNDNSVYELDVDTYDENGDALIATRISQVVHKDRRRLRVHRLELDVETGVGTATGQGSDPVIFMEYSRDGGHTWQNEQSRSLGKIGEYGARVYWINLGQARQWLFRFYVSDPVAVNISGGYADMTVDAA